MIHMPFLAGDLIDSYVEKVAKISVRQSIVDNVFNGFTYCIPMEYNVSEFVFPFLLEVEARLRG
jgi:hypothetical protein